VISPGCCTDTSTKFVRDDRPARLRAAALLPFEDVAVLVVHARVGLGRALLADHDPRSVLLIRAASTRPVFGLGWAPW
jgi:hypothetical protein